MRYDFTIIHALNAADDEEAKKQAVKILQAVAILNRGGFINFDKLGLQLLRPDGTEVDLPEPQFPKGNKVGGDEL